MDKNKLLNTEADADLQISILLVAEEPRVAVPVLHTADLPVVTDVVAVVAVPGAAVVAPLVVLPGVVGEEVGREDVGVGAGVLAALVEPGVLAGVLVSPAGSLALLTAVVRGTFVLTLSLHRGEQC